MGETDNSDQLENETEHVPQIGETLDACTVIADGEEVETGVYELDRDGFEIRAELHEAVITAVEVDQ